MKAIICGGRDVRLTPEDKEYLKTLGITEVVSGAAKGVDEDAIVWAEENNLPCTKMPAKWEDITHADAKIRTRFDGTKYDVLAGFRRNEEMAKISEACVVFKGGNGTAHMMKMAKKYNLKIFSTVYPTE